MANIRSAKYDPDGVTIHLMIVDTERPEIEVNPETGEVVYGEEVEVGEPYLFVLTPESAKGISPQLRAKVQDIAIEPADPVEPPPEPTPEEIRAAMDPLAPNSLRQALIDNSIMPSEITALIAAMPDGEEKERTQATWEYAMYFTRSHPLTGTIGASKGLTPEQTDTMWLAALEKYGPYTGPR